MLSHATRKLINQRLNDEVGRIDKVAPERVALAYPSPYTVGMSSLGYQQVYRRLQAMSGICCERVFLPDGADRAGVRITEAPVSYEAKRHLGEFSLVAFSVAYELELAGLVKMLDASGIPVERTQRGAKDPFILFGGPLTFSNPLPLAPFVDAIILGEAEHIVEFATEVILGASSREMALQVLADHPHIFVPSLNEVPLKPVARCEDPDLPARSAIRTPHTELANMFLIEAERGCSRSCQYCVMRRSTNGGMRTVTQERLLELIPEDAPKVGLVGAAVSDHPRIAQIVDTLAEQGKGVGLSSLRPDRLKEPLVFALKKAGYRTLTTALDGISEGMREVIERRGREPHFRQAAELTRSAQLKRLKLYLMLGLPGETEEDIDEGIGFVTQLSQRIPIALGIAPFCAKRKTPLDGQAFAGTDLVDRHLTRLRKGLKGKVDVRSTSAKWAWVEYVLAQGNEEEGMAALKAIRNGGRFADYRKAFAELGYQHKARQEPRIRVAPEAPYVSEKKRLRLAARQAGE